MLYVKVDGKERKIIFRHDKRTEDIFEQGTKITKTCTKPYQTVCGIFDGEIAIGEGVAKVHKNDRFEYTKGRKIALRYALQAAGMTRDERRQIWEQYNAR